MPITVREPSDEIQKMTSAILAVRRIDREREPQLGVRVSDIEMRRHDADNRPPASADFHLGADDLLAAAERRLPQLVGQHRDWRSVRQRFLKLEDPSAHRRDAQRVEQIDVGGSVVHAPRLVRCR